MAIGGELDNALNQRIDKGNDAKIFRHKVVLLE